MGTDIFRFEWFAGLLAIAIALTGIILSVLQARERQKKEESLAKAEKSAFEDLPAAIQSKIQALEDLEEPSRDHLVKVDTLVQESRRLLDYGTLFNLYSKRIESYHVQTRFRARWSFFWAIVAMAAGLIFVIWGAAKVLQQSGWENIAAGSAIAAIGGAVSSYISKTFLDVHKTSLNQLNRYFRQPVLNEQVLTAQRLADNLDDESARKQAYLSTISALNEQIKQSDEGTPRA